MGAEIDVVDDLATDVTPLHKAAEANAAGAVSVLLAAGAKVDVEDIFGSTPIERAIRVGADEAVAVLGSGRIVGATELRD